MVSKPYPLVDWLDWKLMMTFHPRPGGGRGVGTRCFRTEVAAGGCGRRTGLASPSRYSSGGGLVGVRSGWTGKCLDAEYVLRRRNKPAEFRISQRKRGGAGSVSREAADYEV